jgi:hypothetical protein
MGNSFADLLWMAVTIICIGVFVIFSIIGLKRNPDLAEPDHEDKLD